jgi:hypothetical protein
MPGFQSQEIFYCYNTYSKNYLSNSVNLTGLLYTSKEPEFGAHPRCRFINLVLRPNTSSVEAVPLRTIWDCSSYRFYCGSLAKMAFRAYPITVCGLPWGKQNCSPLVYTFFNTEIQRLCKKGILGKAT